MKDNPIDRFYSTKAWRKCRASFVASRNGLCERCLAKGLITAGTDVHHKIRLSMDNLNDPSIALNPANLELLCTDCHHEEHDGAVRYRVSPDGVVIL